MKKRLSMLIAAIIMFSAVFSLPISVSAESLYIRKIVSVVYDDSGSMEGNKWAYANYAMQSFCGMLNAEDQLFITYMCHSQMTTNYDPKKIDLSAGGIQSSVDSIRRHTDSGSTPYTAVETAFEKLKSVKDTNPNTQYWLVVITDGAFDECNTMSNNKRKNFLNENFKDYIKRVMPNGTNPQVTFLGIGDVASPDEDKNKGIYTYSASNADAIIGAMSKMADRISGRTRLDKDDIKKIDDKTVQVSSSIPLLNIAVFAQGSQARVTKAFFNNEIDIPVSRKVSLGYPGYSDLVGGAYLLGDSKNVIGSGTYNITFDSNVDLDDIIVLFEPALEMRMSITVNGKEITDYSELDNVMENDKISISCKIYEMGTDTEIDPSLMPPGTKFEITVMEDGKVVEQESGKTMLLSDYVLKNAETEITASVVIEGFNPIDYSEKFTPAKYVPKVVYTITADYGSDVRNVKLDNISKNKDLTVYFTVYADGTPLTSVNALKGLDPVITVSPDGNNGDISYSNDGKIIFTPNSASVTPGNDGSFDVDVTCTLNNGASASKTYTVLISSYQVIPIDTDESVVRTGWYDNNVSVSFYITKDGVKLDKEAVEKHISVSLNEKQSKLKTNVSVSPDGTITVTPYTDEEHTLTFLSWWTNWFYYFFEVSGEDVTVTLDHAFGSAESTIDVTEETFIYQLLNVYAPLFLESVALILFVIWLILVITKPRYNKSATLYVGSIKYNSENCTHYVRDFTAVKLVKFNKIKKGNGRLKFKTTADAVNARGIRIRADRDGRIICEMTFPWYKGRLEPADSDYNNLRNPADIADYIAKHKRLEVNEFAMTEKINADYESAILPANLRAPKYIVIPESGPTGVGEVNDRKVIRSGKIFIYVNQ